MGSRPIGRDRRHNPIPHFSLWIRFTVSWLFWTPITQVTEGKR